MDEPVQSGKTGVLPDIRLFALLAAMPFLFALGWFLFGLFGGAAPMYCFTAVLFLVAACLAAWEFSYYWKRREQYPQAIVVPLATLAVFDALLVIAYGILGLFVWYYTSMA